MKNPERATAQVKRSSADQRASWITPRTRLYGLLGSPVAQSLSPQMQNAALAAAELDAVYLAFEVVPAQLPAALEGLRQAGVAGLNLTVPHKRLVLPHLQRITAHANRLGAVNTIRLDQDGWNGTNTDGEGFMHALAEDLAWQPQGKTVLLLGAGGAARSIANVLLEAGIATLHIANRDRHKAATWANALRDAVPSASIAVHPLPPPPALQADLLINTTSVGMGDGQSPLKLSHYTIGEGVVDIVYHPPQTPLLQQAAALGLPRAGGLGMLLHQGAAAFRYWHGLTPPLTAMRTALTQALGRV